MQFEKVITYKMELTEEELTNIQNALNEKINVGTATPIQSTILNTIQSQK